MTISSDWKAPAMRPTLARTSSAASGLRFCGMIEEPVVNLSERRTNANWGVIQITISSASRDRCTAVIAAAASVSSTKSRSATASSELRRRPVEAQRLGRHVPVDGKGGAGERGRAQRAFVEPRAGIREPAAVALEHLDIGQQMVAEGDGLGRLQMREARHRQVEMRLGLARQGELQGGERRVRAVDPVAHIELEVGRHLVVARAGRMQPPGRLADQLLEPALDVHVHVLERAREHEPPGLDLLEHLVEAGVYLLEVLLGDDALGRQHGGMRLGGADVLRRQSLVEVDGGVYLLHDLRGRLEKRPPHILLALFSVTRLPRPGLLMREPGDEMLGKNRQPGAARTGLSTALWAAAIAALAGFVVVYVTLGRPDNAVSPAAQAPAPSGTGTNPLSRGHMAAFVFRKAPEDLPEVKFLDATARSARWPTGAARSCC